MREDAEAAGGHVTGAQRCGGDVSAQQLGDLAARWRAGCHVVLYCTRSENRAPRAAARLVERLERAAAPGSSGSSSDGGGNGAVARTSCAGGMLKGVAGGAIGKSTRKARAPSTSWVAQDLGVIGSLISAHLQRSEGVGAPDPATAATAAARASAAGAAQPAPSSAGASTGTGGGEATATASAVSSDARVAVVVDELAMTIADQALGSSSLGL